MCCLYVWGLVYSIIFSISLYCDRTKALPTMEYIHFSHNSARVYIRILFSCMHARRYCWQRRSSGSRKFKWRMNQAQVKRWNTHITSHITYHTNILVNNAIILCILQWRHLRLKWFRRFRDNLLIYIFIINSRRNFKGKKSIFTFSLMKCERYLPKIDSNSD